MSGKEHANLERNYLSRNHMGEHFLDGTSEQSSIQDDVGRSLSQERRGSVISLFRQILAQSPAYKLVFFASTLAYGILYDYSSGGFFYYSVNITPYLKESGVTNPYFLSARNLAGLYYSGMIWYPTSHLQFNILVGSTFFTVFLSTLFGSSILLLVYSFRFKGLGKKRQGIMGLFGMIPAIFSGGCCAVPIATLLLGSIVPSTVLANIEYGDPLLLNLLISGLMLFSIFYTARKLVKTRDACAVCKS